MYNPEETIYALASGAGKAGVAVIRISGKQSLSILQTLTGIHSPKARYAYFSLLKHNDKVIDQALVLYFSAPNSFTGEDILELHIHGGQSIINSLFSILSSFQNCRPAEAGEFSRRAVINGKMDLTQAEGIMDLVDAQTEAQREQSLKQVQGELHDILDNWRHTLIKIEGYLEAFIDFPEEEIPQEKSLEINTKISHLIDEISSYLDDNYAAQRLRDGFKVVLYGVTNVGKSSLLNTLTKKEMAIVSSIAGTTRDVIEGHIDIAGFPIILSDTAGIRKTKGYLENKGIQRTLSKLQEADLILNIQDVKNYPKKQPLPISHPCVLEVWNKSDLKNTVPDTNLKISTKTGKGIPELISKITSILKEKYTSTSLITRERYRIALKECTYHLSNSLNVEELELKSEDIRLAARSLGRITGIIETNDILDVIFKEFCIGK